MNQDAAGEDLGQRLKNGLAGKVTGQLGAESYDLMAALGGVRGLIESTAPTVVFLFVFLLGNNLAAALIASLAVAAIAVVVRLAGRLPITPAISGLLGVGIASAWAWHSGRAENFFSWGLAVNAVWLVGTLISLAVRFPLVGALVGIATSTWQTWRSSSHYARFVWATWLWAALFAARIAVQGPLLLGGDVGWLGSARLVMGVPLFALVGLATWFIVRPAVLEARESAESPPETPHP